MQSISLLIPMLTFCQTAYNVDIEALAIIEEWAKKSERIKIDDISKQISETIYYPYSLKKGDDIDLKQLKNFLGRKITVSLFFSRNSWAYLDHRCSSRVS
ncbi:hypothetical protein Y032_0014g2379 [Ancylostoma ceylanicum]|uniref:Uncharacterized protein n=1 Tax=Ancylostoma ceylanicum TaxID=53326 RepID=A0A016V9U4_9BILA|nr:hypothetical protein Y032_0014g2379 [Ancylostoma ceylanicum]